MERLLIKRAKEQDEQKLRTILSENGQKPTIVINDESLYFFAEIDTEKIGLIGAEISGKVALVRSLAVIQKWRNNGFSNALVHALFTELKKREIEHLYLFSRDTGGYWAKIGFTLCDIQEIINHLSNAPQVTGYIKDNSIWTDVAWHRTV